MTPLHLVRVTPFVAASLLCSEVALAQSSTSASLPSSASTSPAGSERFRVRLPSTQAAPAPRPMPGPWVSMVPSDPFSLRGPSFQGLRTMPFSLQAATDPAMESRFVARRTVGGVLLGLSSPFLVTSGWLFYQVSGISAGPYGVGLLVGAGGVFLGVTSLLIGAGLFIPGLVYSVTDPPPPESAMYRLRPTLHVRPDGVGLSMSF